MFLSVIANIEEKYIAMQPFFIYCLPVPAYQGIKKPLGHHILWPSDQGMSPTKQMQVDFKQQFAKR